MNSVILFCPHLNRDISSILEKMPDAFIMIGLPTAQGHDGCLEMHKSAVRMAMEEGWSEICVMEDDCAFTKNFDAARWRADADWARANGYDVLVGGCTRTYDEVIVRSGLIEVSAFHSAHCVVYLESAYERVLKAVQPFDVSLGRDCGCRIVMVYPFVAVQRPSFSGILQQDVNYVPLYEQHERRLGALLGIAS